MVTVLTGVQFAVMCQCCVTEHDVACAGQDLDLVFSSLHCKYHTHTHTQHSGDKVQKVNTRQPYYNAVAGRQSTVCSVL